jgi:hypothetical protein
MLAPLFALEAVSSGTGSAALFDPAVHAVLLIESIGAALGGVVVGVAPRDEREVHLHYQEQKETVERMSARACLLCFRLFALEIMFLLTMSATPSAVMASFTAPFTVIWHSGQEASP